MSMLLGNSVKQFLGTAGQTFDRFVHNFRISFFEAEAQENCFWPPQLCCQNQKLIGLIQEHNRNQRLCHKERGSFKGFDCQYLNNLQMLVMVLFEQLSFFVAESVEVCNWRTSQLQEILSLYFSRTYQLFSLLAAINILLNQF